MQSLNIQKSHVLFEYLQENDIQIACLTETWFHDLNNFQTSLIQEGGSYTVYNKPRVTETIGGGVCILIKDKYTSVLQKSKSFSSFENVVILCNVSNLPSQKLRIISIYRREAVVFSTFIDEFTKFVDELTLSKYPYIIAGDYNIHMNDTRHSYTKRFLKMCRERNLDIDNVPSSKTHIAGNTLDFLVCDSFASSLITGHSIDTNSPKISHQYPVIYSFCSSLNTRTLAEQKPTRKYLNFNLDNFKQDLSVSLAELSSYTSFPEKYQFYQEKLGAVFDHHVPLTVSKIRHNVRPKWMDHNYVLERAYRRKLERKYKRTGSNHDQIQYSIQRTKCSLLVGEKRGDFYTNMAHQANGNAKTLFKLYDKLVENSSKNKQILPDIDQYGSNHGLATSFNNFFIEKVNKTQSHIRAENHDVDVSSCHTPHLQSSESSQHLTCFRLCEFNELKEIVMKHGIKTTHPLDPLTKQLMASCLDIIMPHLLDLVNTSLISGCIDGVKFALIKPLLKKMDLDCSMLLSYRPISNLSFISKIIERVVAKQLDEHMLKNNLHVDSQHGYKAGHSTETLLLKFYNDILVAIDKNRGVVVLLVDLSSAFDTVQHKLLLDILKDSLYIRGTALEWFQSFLCGRSQAVIIDGVQSDWLTVSCGVPQGSVLGPILFNIYCRYIHCVFEDCGFTSSSYADDNSALKTFALFNQVNVLHEDVPNCIYQLKQYMNRHSLKLNDSKTEIIVFGNSSLKEQLHIHGTFLKSGTCIRFADNVTYLGIMFDSLLSFDQQITSIVSSSYASIRKLSSMRKYLSKSDMEKFVHAFISSKLDSCNSLFYGLPKKTLNKLQKIQNAAIRLVCNVRFRHPVSLLYEQLHWLKVEQRLIYKALLLVYKCVHGLAPNMLQSMCQIRNQDNLTLRDTYFNRTKYGKRAFIYYSSRLWNKLPVDIRIIENIDTFKKALKSFLILHSDRMR